MTRPRALVTGASSGIGACFARHLARTGHDLVLVARREETLRGMADEFESLDVVAEVIAADLATPAGVAAVAERIETGEAIDLLVNSAGILARAPVAELDAAAFEAMIQLNIVALARLSQAAMARMLADGRGTIVNVGSGTMFLQRPGAAGYAASKCFVAQFTRHMQLEAAGTGVRVQLLIPGVVATPFAANAGGSLDQFPRERVMAVDDVVVASLRALEMGELVCVPSLPDIAAWDDYVSAERQVGMNVSRDALAPRYHGRH